MAERERLFDRHLPRRTRHVQAVAGSVRHSARVSGGVEGGIYFATASLGGSHIHAVCSCHSRSRSARLYHLLHRLGTDATPSQCGVEVRGCIAAHILCYDFKREQLRTRSTRLLPLSLSARLCRQHPTKSTILRGPVAAAHHSPPSQLQMKRQHRSRE